MIKIKHIAGAYLMPASYDEVEINGKRYPKFKEEVTIEKPVTIYRVRQTREIVRYGELSVEDYKAMKDRLLQDAEFYDTGHYLFPTIPAKDAWEKFQKEYPPVYEPVEVLDPVKFEIVEFPESQSPFIIPLRMLGEAKPLFKYETNWTALFDLCSPEFPNVKHYEVGTGRVGNTTALRSFTKINGEYISGSDRLGRNLIGSYEECEHSLNRDIETVRHLLTIASAKGLKLADVQSFYKKVSIIYGLVTKLDVKKAAEVDLSVVRTKINEVLTLLANEAAQNQSS